MLYLGWGVILLGLFAGAIYCSRKIEKGGEDNVKVQHLEGIIADEKKAIQIRSRMVSDNAYAERVREKFSRD